MHTPSEQNCIQQLSIDCVIFGYQEKQLNVLVPKLDFRGDFWAVEKALETLRQNLDEKLIAFNLLP